MRKLIIGLVTFVMSFVFMTSNVASAEELGGEDPTPTPVGCTVQDTTDPALVNDDGTYDTDTPISLEVILDDPESRVARIVFAAGMDQNGDILQDGSTTTVTWYPIAPGEWVVGARLFEEDGTEITTTGDCKVTLVVVKSEPKPCGNPDSMTLVPRDDGSTDVYDGDVYCASVMPEVVSPGPSAPVSEPTELPRTGSRTAELSFLGFGLLTLGWAISLISVSRKKKFSQLA